MVMKIPRGVRAVAHVYLIPKSNAQIEAYMDSWFERIPNTLQWDRTKPIKQGRVIEASVSDSIDMDDGI